MTVYINVEIIKELLEAIRKKYPKETNNMTDSSVVNWVISDLILVT